MEQAEGFRWRERRALELLACHAAWVLTPYAKRPITAQDLLAPVPENPEAALDRMLGLHDPMKDLDAALAVQAERRMRGR